MTTKQKVTELRGYFATGDYECFVFDKHPRPENKHERIDNKRGIERCRVPPNELIPQGTYGKKGNWKITVDFEEVH